MANTSTRQLLLVADHLKLSLLERSRAVSLNLDSTKQDAQITRSLTQLRDGIEALDAETEYHDDVEDAPSDLALLRTQYQTLYKQFHNEEPPSSSTRQPNDPGLAETFAAAQTQPPRNKNVRFRDNPNALDEDAVEISNRAALFADQERYRDEEPTLDQSQLDNQQIHAYHKQVLRDQDEQLDSLGQSIGRQRLLGIQMGNELDEQNELLDDVERGVDRHSTTLERAAKRLGHVARKSKANASWITIAILVIILILVIAILK